MAKNSARKIRRAQERRLLEEANKAKLQSQVDQKNNTEASQPPPPPQSAVSYPLRYCKAFFAAYADVLKADKIMMGIAFLVPLIIQIYRQGWKFDAWKDNSRTVGLSLIIAICVLGCYYAIKVVWVLHKEDKKRFSIDHAGVKAVPLGWRTGMAMAGLLWVVFIFCIFASSKYIDYPSENLRARLHVQRINMRPDARKAANAPMIVGFANMTFETQNIGQSAIIGDTLISSIVVVASPPSTEQDLAKLFSSNRQYTHIRPNDNLPPGALFSEDSDSHYMIEPGDWEQVASGKFVIYALMTFWYGDKYGRRETQAVSYFRMRSNIFGSKELMRIDLPDKHRDVPSTK